MAHGKAMIILNLIPEEILSFNSFSSRFVYAATALGIIEEAIDVEIAIGSVVKRRYLELYIPTIDLIVTESIPLPPSTSPNR